MVRYQFRDSFDELDESQSWINEEQFMATLPGGRAQENYAAPNDGIKPLEADEDGVVWDDDDDDCGVEDQGPDNYEEDRDELDWEGEDLEGYDEYGENEDLPSKPARGKPRFDDEDEEGKRRDRRREQDHARRRRRGRDEWPGDEDEDA